MDALWQSLPSFTGLVNVTVTAVTDHSVTYVDQSARTTRFRRMTLLPV